jgi:ABC-type multidrug transport system fused ATPase/permease subunit
MNIVNGLKAGTSAFASSFMERNGWRGFAYAAAGAAGFVYGEWFSNPGGVALFAAIAVVVVRSVYLRSIEDGEAQAAFAKALKEAAAVRFVYGDDALRPDVLKALKDEEKRKAKQRVWREREVRLEALFEPVVDLFRMLFALAILGAAVALIVMSVAASPVAGLLVVIAVILFVLLLLLLNMAKE